MHSVLNRTQAILGIQIRGWLLLLLFFDCALALILVSFNFFRQFRLDSVHALDRQLGPVPLLEDALLRLGV